MFSIITAILQCFPSPSLPEEEEEKKDTALDALDRVNQLPGELQKIIFGMCQQKSDEKEQEPRHVIVRTFDGGKFNIPFSKFGKDGNPLEGIDVSPEDVRSLTFSKDIDCLSGDNYWREGFKNLTSVDFERGSELHTIGNYCFSGCFNLSTIVFPEKLVTIGDYAIEATSVSQIDLPSSVKNIGDSAFWIDTLRKVMAPKGIPRFYVGKGVNVKRY